MCPQDYTITGASTNTICVAWGRATHLSENIPEILCLNVVL